MFTISPSIRLAKSQDGAVVLDIEQGAMFSLNRVGTRVIELLKEGYELPSLVESIGREFQVSAESVRGDIADFLLNLEEQHVLIEADRGDRSERGGEK